MKGGNGFIPDIRAPHDIGVKLNRKPQKMGSITTSSSGASTGIRLDCTPGGFVEFGGDFANWEFAYVESPKEWFAINPGEMWPASGMGAILIRETSSGIGLGTVEPKDWNYEAGFVRALTASEQTKGSVGSKLAYNNATVANSKYGATRIGGVSGRKTIVTWYGSVSAAVTLTLVYSFDGTTWYASSTTIVKGAAGDFAQDFLTAAPYVALMPDAILATLTAYLAWR